jgi:UDP-N-acetylmuramoyl-L-alanyl-D-glutamate--2,6-diaminopimelate ligase
MASPSPTQLETFYEQIKDSLRPYVDPEASPSARLKGVTADSREVAPGMAFVAVRGGTRDGHRFIAQAVKDGAALVVGEEPLAQHAESMGRVPYVEVADSRLALAYLAAQLAGNPSHALTVVGVTGTSGKTTTTYLIESVLKSAGHKVGVIGTVNFRSGNRIYPSTHTTPGSPELQKLLSEMRQDGCTAVVMEVSSHALKQHRVAYIAFDAVVFTNLSPEHQDFHPDMEDYYRSKAILFNESLKYSIRAGKRPFAAVTEDDRWGRRLLSELRADPQPETWFASFGLAAGADVNARNIRLDLKGIRGEAGGIRVRSELTGHFNVQNILGAILAGQGLHINPVAIGEGIAALKCVPGRLERVPNDKGVYVMVDYAHKSDALSKVLRTLRGVRGVQNGGRLITVFGCGGDRDRQKRPVMGRTASALSDHVFVTSDNPRTEDPQAIIDEILRGIAEPERARVTVEPDRRKAIYASLQMAKPGDLVLVAGKGHEDYQIVGTQKLPFDDRQVAIEALSALP